MSSSVKSGWRQANQTWKNPSASIRGKNPTFNAEEELAAADHPNIRIFKIAKTLAAKPQADLTKFDGWQECNSERAGFRQLFCRSVSLQTGDSRRSERARRPHRIFVGSYTLEPWIPATGFEEVARLAKFATAETSTNRISNARPMTIYNAMIAPIVGFTMRGALWYQGESNLMGTNADNDYAAL